MSLRVEVINTGNELLLGTTVNSHLAYFGERLLPFGLEISRQVCVPDGAVIREAMLEAFGRAEIVFVTGGLGPTSDDVTREICAELFDVALKEDSTVFSAIEARLARRKVELNDNTRRQAQVPVGAQVLFNDWGTAPGLYFAPRKFAGAARGNSPHLFLLPGPPRELIPMFQERVEPLLATICQGKTRLRQMRNFRIFGPGESEVARTLEPSLLAIGDLEIGYCARPGEVIVRVLGSPAQLAAAGCVVAAAFPSQFFSDDDSEMEVVLVRLLQRLGQTLSTAESCTGGCIAHRITNVAGASEVFISGMVTYANEAKADMLRVSCDVLDKYGAVSEETCREMVAGCLARTGTDHALAITGIAGPGGGSEGKPVGTAYIGLGSRNRDPLVIRVLMPYERITFKQMASQAALDLLRRRILGIC